LLAAELAAANVDVIVAGGTPATLAAQKATSRIPIVAGNVTDPIKFAMTTSLARPSANVTGTGTGNMGLEISGKRLDILRALVPNARRVGVFINLGNPANAITPIGAQRFRDAGIEIIELGVRKPAEIEPAFQTAQSRRADVVQIPTDGLFNGETKRMAQWALAYRLPCLGGFCRFVHDGGLASFGADYEQIWRQAGVYVGRILKGAKPAELPFVLGDKFDFCLNRKTATALGLAVAPELLLRADLVVE
jgi:putative ABC transport system substrate-binding protein